MCLFEFIPFTYVSYFFIKKKYVSYFIKVMLLPIVLSFRFRKVCTELSLIFSVILLGYHANLLVLLLIPCIDQDKKDSRLIIFIYHFFGKFLLQIFFSFQLLRCKLIARLPASLTHCRLSSSLLALPVVLSSFLIFSSFSSLQSNSTCLSKKKTKAYIIYKINS